MIRYRDALSVGLLGFLIGESQPSAETGEIATYTKVSKELDQFFDLSEKNINDFDITAYHKGDNKAINIRSSTKVLKCLR